MAAQASGSNIPTPDVGELDDQVIKATMLYHFTERSVNSGSAFSSGALQTRWRIGVISLSSVQESRRTKNASIVDEETSYFNQELSGVSLLVQWRPSPQFASLSGTGATWLNVYVAWVTALQATLRFRNSGTTEEVFVWYKTIFPFEDNINTLFEMTTGSHASPDHVVNVLDAYPGMKKIRLGTNDANGIPNIQYVDIKVDVDEMRDILVKRLGGVAGVNFLSTNDSKIAFSDLIWMQPQSPTETAALNLSEDVNAPSMTPRVCFWASKIGGVEGNAIDSGTLHVEGKMMKNITILRERGAFVVEDPGDPVV